MKTWYVTNVSVSNSTSFSSSGSYSSSLAEKLNELETASHTIFSVQAVSGQIIIISYTSP